MANCPYLSFFYSSWPGHWAKTTIARQLKTRAPGPSAEILAACLLHVIFRILELALAFALHFFHYLRLQLSGASQDYITDVSAPPPLYISPSPYLPYAIIIMPVSVVQLHSTPTLLTITASSTTSDCPISPARSVGANTWVLEGHDPLEKLAEMKEGGWKIEACCRHEGQR